MARDLSAYLQDVLEPCNSIEYVMSGVSLDEYRSKRAVRSAVDREFIIIGDALRRVSALDEGLFSSISNSRATFLVPAWAHCGLVMASVGRIEDRLQAFICTHDRAGCIIYTHE